MTLCIFLTTGLRAQHSFTLSDTAFDSNLGADNVLFTTLTLSGSSPLTLTIAGNPFLYDPAKGNLLLNITISPTGV